MNRRASCVGTFEVFEAAHVALRTLLAFSQPVNCIFWLIGMLNWLVAASKLHKHRETCCTAEWPFYSFLILCLDDANDALHDLRGGPGRPTGPRGARAKTPGLLRTVRRNEKIHGHCHRGDRVCVWIFDHQVFNLNR